MLVKRPYKSLHCLLTHEKEAHFHPVVCDEEQKKRRSTSRRENNNRKNKARCPGRGARSRRDNRDLS